MAFSSLAFSPVEEFLCLRCLLTFISWRAAASNQTSVLDLELANNMLSGSIPTALCTLANLTSLNVSSNQLSGALDMPTALTFTTPCLSIAAVS